MNKEINIISVWDTETQGVDINKHSVIEVAAALIDIKRKCLIRNYSTLIFAEGGNPEDTFLINRIPDEVLRQHYAKNPSLVPFEEMIELSDVLIAHNAEFDKAFLQKLWEEKSLKPINKPWVCTVQDISFPLAAKSKKLTHLATDHGISSIGSVHRAMFDVNLVVELLLKTPDIVAQIEQALEPKELYYADVGFNERHFARNANFIWNPQHKKWIKKLTEEEKEKLDFVVHRLED